jgi:hypothetical protein
LLRNLKKLKPDLSPSTEANGQSFLRRPGPIRGFRANGDDDDLDEEVEKIVCVKEKNIFHLYLRSCGIGCFEQNYQLFP